MLPVDTQDFKILIPAEIGTNRRLGNDGLAGECTIKGGVSVWPVYDIGGVVDATILYRYRRGAYEDDA
jgi:hypothetical protein